MHGSAIVSGVGESAYYKRGGSPDNEFQLACTAIRNAVADAGLEMAEVDGIVTYMDTRNDPLRLAQALGIRDVRWSSHSFGGGGNNVGSVVQMADAAVTAGYARNVVVFRALAQGQFGRFGQSQLAGRAPPSLAWSAVYGLVSPGQECALHTARFMHDHGISQEALCEIALACYANAQRNPRATRYGRPLTREEYHASRWIVEPFHLFDFCPENDGAAAIVVSSAERARDLPKPPVAIVAAAQGGNGPRFGVTAFQDRWFPGTFYRDAARTLWERAGVTAEACDVVQFYENFTGPVLIALVEMGFCEAADAEAFVADGALAGPNARLPFNTSGGNLAEAYIHGFELINEAVRQVRGESTCQADNVELSLVVAGPGYAPGSAVLFGPV